MKRKLFLLLLCCIFLFSFSLTTYAANNKNGKQVKAKTETQKRNVQPENVSVCESVYKSVYAREGFIRLISPTEIVVGKKNKTDETLKITSFTVFKNVKAKQKTAALAELKVGMKVLVKFDENRNATLIKILPQKVEKVKKEVKSKKLSKDKKVTKNQKALKQVKTKVKNVKKKTK